MKCVPSDAQGMDFKGHQRIRVCLPLMLDELVLRQPDVIVLQGRNHLSKPLLDLVKKVAEWKTTENCHVGIMVWPEPKWQSVVVALNHPSRGWLARNWEGDIVPALDEALKHLSASTAGHKVLFIGLDHGEGECVDLQAHQKEMIEWPRKPGKDGKWNPHYRGCIKVAGYLLKSICCDRCTTRCADPPLLAPRRAEQGPPVVPGFTEQQVTARPEIIDLPHPEDSLNYITDVAVRTKVSELLDEIKNWKTGNISIHPIKDGFSMKVNGHVFAYLRPRRKHYIIATYDASDEWKEYAVKTDDDLATVKPIAKAACNVHRAGVPKGSD